MSFYSDLLLSPDGHESEEKHAPEEDPSEPEIFKLPQDDLISSLTHELQIIKEEIVNVPVHLIQRDNPRPLQNKFVNSYPLLLSDFKTYRLLFGEHLVDAAAMNDRSEISCHVLYTQGSTALSRRILRYRLCSVPQGPEMGYAERCLETSGIMHDALESGEFHRYGHGGARKGEGYIRNRVDDLINFIARQTNCTRNTILRQLSDARAINDDLAEELKKQRIGRAFFDAVRSRKNELIRLLEEETEDADGYTEYIAVVVRDNMVRALQEYRTGNIGGDEDEPFRGALSEFRVIANQEYAALSEAIEKEILSEVFNPQLEKGAGKANIFIPGSNGNKSVVFPFVPSIPSKPLIPADNAEAKAASDIAEEIRKRLATVKENIERTAECLTKDQLKVQVKSILENLHKILADLNSGT